MASKAEYLRDRAAKIISNNGRDATLFSYSSATKTTNEEGDVTPSDWGTGISIKGISTGHRDISSSLQVQGSENLPEMTLIVRHDVAVATKDKLTIDGNDWEVEEVQQIDALGVMMYKRLVLSEKS